MEVWPYDANDNLKSAKSKNQIHESNIKRELVSARKPVFKLLT